MTDERTPTDLADAARSAMSGVQELVAADGGDMTLASVSPGTVTLDLILEGAECRECVMPRAFLEQVALDMMKPQLPGLDAVIINDPRETEEVAD